MSTFTVVDLDPVSVSYLTDLTDCDVLTTSAYDLPVLYGGGDLADDSDTSYVEIGTWQEGDGTDHVEPVSADFVLPPGHTAPTAVSLLVRMRNSPATVASPPAFGPSRLISRLGAVSDGSLFGSHDFTALDSFHLANAMVAPATDYPFWWNIVDLDNHTDLGYWFEFDVDSTDPAAVVTALTGDGLRATLAVYATVQLDDTPVRRPWLDVFEFRLLVACTRAPNAPPLRRWPPVNNGGAGPTRHWPKSPGRVAGKSY